MSYRTSLTKLFDLQKYGVKVGLATTLSLLAALGDPHKGAFVHLAGTNGKGSTAVNLEAILMAGGYKTGLYTSPHLVTFRERIRVNGVMITEEETLDLFNRVWSVIDEERPPTYFEFVTAMAFLYFQDQKPDVIILEAGLGGRLDSTNVVSPILTAITNISLEHTEFLGDTLEAIAAEKAGIIKPQIPLVGGRIEEPALGVIKKKLAELKAPGYFYNQDYKFVPQAKNPSFFDYEGPNLKVTNLKPSLLGPYQVENAAQAVALAELLTLRGFPLEPSAIREGLSRAQWPGRAQRMEPGSWPPDGSSKAPLVLDGAHNPGGAQAFSSYLAALGAQKIHLIAGVMADKDVAGVLSPLIALADRLYLTRPEYARAADPQALLDRLTAALGPIAQPHDLYPSLPLALAAAAKNAAASDLVVVSGSLFTVGETLAYLTGQPVVEPN
ncbi:MAG: bifunctional folylpolyglutamate synthase/dihydrofolate synthase [Deltaproteobacteria bacterium]|jgi:dihydrofolate synthase/folylpolyglutamate synthase|nr:bifunctional folylpolyglutamate synthase/dihydrofolate synthase [Deltaproteobacteria bacterium]